MSYILVHPCCIGTPFPKILIGNCSSSLTWKANQKQPLQASKELVFLSSLGISCHCYNAGWPSSFSELEGFGWQFAIDHGHFVWNISTIFTTAVHLPTCVPAKLPLIHTSLKTQEFGLALALAPTKPQLDLHNIPTKSHMNKHTHVPAHTQTQMVSRRK